MRRDLGGLRPRGQRDQRALVDEDVVREAAVAGQAREAVALAEEVVAASARNAEPARECRIHEDRIADLGGRHVVSDGVHPTCALVSEHDRRLESCRLHLSLDRVQVGRAHAGTADAYDDVACRDRLRLGSLDELERTVVLAEKRSSHATAAAPALFEPR